MPKKVTLTWTQPAATNFHHYEVWRNIDAGAYAQVGSDISAIATEEYVDDNGGAGLADNTYHYQVRTYNSAGDYESASILIVEAVVEGVDPDNIWSNQLFEDANSDGVADSVSVIAPSTIDASIVTGGGHTGNAQRIENDGSSNVSLRLPVNFEAGKTYDVTFGAKNDKTDAFCKLSVLGQTPASNGQITVGGDGSSYHDVVDQLIIDTASSYLYIYANSTAGNTSFLEISNLIIKEA